MLRAVLQEPDRIPNTFPGVTPNVGDKRLPRDACAEKNRLDRVKVGDPERLAGLGEIDRL